MEFKALETYLLPLKKVFSEDGVNEISINRPGEAWVEKMGDIIKIKLEEFSQSHLVALSKLIAQSTDQQISEERPILSATLPAGYRVQIVIPPACEPGTVIFSIRKQSPLKWTLDDYERMGAFESTTYEETVDEKDIELAGYLKKNDTKSFLHKSVLYKKNIIISGGTSTGKTTFTNAALRSIPQDERLITVEDAREVDLDHPNRVHLLASKGGQGRANVTTQDLIEACLRLRPDRIIVGELRGSEAFSFLRAINTGHPGSISTLHADTPDMAKEQLKLMVMQAGLGIPPEQIAEYIYNVIDVIVQLKRGAKGKRFVSQIYFKGLDDLKRLGVNINGQVK
ncbi:MAG: P-type DNA transfer ATPase VirB11 [Rickettsiales bacterium]|nr:P-type DNA transfer ATPase VirB11 [Rickettsiales bacterium]